VPFNVPPIEQINPSNFNLAKPDVLSAGAKAAAANPMAFAKQNLGNSLRRCTNCSRLDGSHNHKNA
jgi:hypothetical protein